MVSLVSKGGIFAVFLSGFAVKKGFFFAV